MNSFSQLCIKPCVCWTVHVMVSEIDPVLKWCQISSIAITLCSLLSVLLGAVSAQIHISCLCFQSSYQGFFIFILSFFCQNKTVISTLICPQFPCLCCIALQFHPCAASFSYLCSWNFIHPSKAHNSFHVSSGDWILVSMLSRDLQTHTTAHTSQSTLT